VALVLTLVSAFRSTFINIITISAVPIQSVSSVAGTYECPNCVATAVSTATIVTGTLINITTVFPIQIVSSIAGAVVRSISVVTVLSTAPIVAGAFIGILACSII
jgi:hypothetical protein